MPKSWELEGGTQEFGFIEGNGLQGKLTLNPVDGQLRFFQIRLKGARTPDEGGHSEGKIHSRITRIPHWNL